MQKAMCFLFNLLATVTQYVWIPRFVEGWIADGCERYTPANHIWRNEPMGAKTDFTLPDTRYQREILWALLQIGPATADDIALRVSFIVYLGVPSDELDSRDTTVNPNDVKHCLEYMWQCGLLSRVMPADLWRISPQALRSDLFV